MKETQNAIQKRERNKGKKKIKEQKWKGNKKSRR